MLNNRYLKDTLVVTQSKEYAREIRRAYAAGMQNAQLRKSFPRMRQMASRMIQIIEPKRGHGSIDFQKLCVQYSLDIVGVTAMETNLGGLDESSYIREGIIDTDRIGREQPIPCSQNIARSFQIQNSPKIEQKGSTNSMKNGFD